MIVLVCLTLSVLAYTDGWYYNNPYTGKPDYFRNYVASDFNVTGGNGSGGNTTILVSNNITEASFNNTFLIRPNPMFANKNGSQVYYDAGGIFNGSQDGSARSVFRIDCSGNESTSGLPANCTPFDVSFYDEQIGLQRFVSRLNVTRLQVEELFFRPYGNPYSTIFNPESIDIYNVSSFSFINKWDNNRPEYAPNNWLIGSFDVVQYYGNKTLFQVRTYTLDGTVSDVRPLKIDGYPALGQQMSNVTIEELQVVPATTVAGKANIGGSKNNNRWNYTFSLYVNATREVQTRNLSVSDYAYITELNASKTNLTTTQIVEGTNLYYTDLKASTALQNSTIGRTGTGQCVGTDKVYNVTVNSSGTYVLCGADVSGGGGGGLLTINSPNNSVVVVQNTTHANITINTSYIGTVYAKERNVSFITLDNGSANGARVSIVPYNQAANGAVYAPAVNTSIIEFWSGNISTDSDIYKFGYAYFDADNLYGWDTDGAGTLFNQTALYLKVYRGSNNYMGNYEWRMPVPYSGGTNGLAFEDQAAVLRWLNSSGGNRLSLTNGQLNLIDPINAMKYDSDLGHFFKARTRGATVFKFNDFFTIFSGATDASNYFELGADFYPRTVMGNYSIGLSSTYWTNLFVKNIFTNNITVNGNATIQTLNVTNGTWINTTNCDSLDTTATGLIICGTDSTGTGGGSLSINSPNASIVVAQNTTHANITINLTYMSNNFQNNTFRENNQTLNTSGNVTFNKITADNSILLYGGVEAKHTQMYFCDFMVAQSVTMCYPDFFGIATTGTSASVNGNATRFGIVSISDATGANTGYSYNMGVSTLLLNGSEQFKTGFQIVTSTFANQSTIRFGFLDVTTPTAAIADGVYCTVSYNTSRSTLGCYTNNNSIINQTVTNLSINTDWYDAIITVVNTTSANFQLYNNSGLVYNENLTNLIPQTVGRETGAGINAGSTTAGTATVVANIDYVMMEIERVRRPYMT